MSRRWSPWESSRSIGSRRGEVRWTQGEGVLCLLRVYVCVAFKCSHAPSALLPSQDLSKGKRPEHLVSVDPMANLYSALRVLLEERIHRLPVIDSLTGNATSILTHKRILQLILSNVRPIFLASFFGCRQTLPLGAWLSLAPHDVTPPLCMLLSQIQDDAVKPVLNTPIKKLSIGTFKNIATVSILAVVTGFIAPLCIRVWFPRLTNALIALKILFPFTRSSPTRR